jgi:hypothetical protein
MRMTAKKDRDLTDMDLEIEPLTFLRIVRPPNAYDGESYYTMLNSLLVAEAILAKKDNSAMQHFIAVVKELERVHGFTFKSFTQEELDERNRPHISEDENLPF